MPLGLSAVVMATLLALGALLALSLDAHSRAAPELRAKFLVVRARDRARATAPAPAFRARLRTRCVTQVGDWGREGKLNQSEVARAMAASGFEPDFVIRTGDNFYVRPSSTFSPSGCCPYACYPPTCRACDKTVLSQSAQVTLLLYKYTALLTACTSRGPRCFLPASAPRLILLVIAAFRCTFYRAVGTRANMCRRCDRRAA